MLVKIGHFSLSPICCLGLPSTIRGCTQVLVGLSMKYLLVRPEPTRVEALITSHYKVRLLGYPLSTKIYHPEKTWQIQTNKEKVVSEA